MLKYLKANAVVIAISVSFFVPSFLFAAELFELSDREMVIALVASVVCAVTILATSMATAQVKPFLLARLDAPK
jgi:hypothetical protein